MLEKGIKISAGSDGNFRFVVHNDISHSDINYTIEILKSIMNQYHDFIL